MRYFAENTPQLAMQGAPGWGSVSWQTIGYDKSHFNIADWCPAGTYLIRFDLDDDARFGAANSPIVGFARCAKQPRVGAGSPSVWRTVGYNQSHSPQGEWCPSGTFISQLDLDGDNSHGADNGPIIAGVLCGRTSFGLWAKSFWFGMFGTFKSHQDLGEWCPAGSFLTQLDLEGGGLAMSWPIVKRRNARFLLR